MDFDIPPRLQSYLSELDDFIESDIKPLENQDDNIRFLTIEERTPEQTGRGMGCLMRSGRSYS